MSNLPRELHADFAHPEIAAPVVYLAVSVDVTETAGREIPAFTCPRELELVGASYLQESSAANAAVQLHNHTDDENLSDDLDIGALGAAEGAQFAGIQNTRLEKGDVVVLDYDSTGSTTAPDEITVVFELQLME